MELKWDYVLAIIIVVVIGIAIITGKATTQDLLAIISMIFAFLTGGYAVTTLAKRVEKLDSSR